MATLKEFLAEPLIPYERDEITRLIFDSHRRDAFAPISHLTVGEFRDWLLDSDITGEILAALAPGLTPEIQDLVDSQVVVGAGGRPGGTLDWIALTREVKRIAPDYAD